MPNLDLTDDDTLRGHVLDWLVANDINPRSIPADPHMTLVGDQLTTDQKIQDADGHDQIAPDLPDRVARRTITVTVAVAPPEDVLAWLLPRCPTCGR